MAWAFLLNLAFVSSAGAVSRPVFCAALLTTARTTSRPADAGALRAVVTQSLRFQSLRNQMLTDVTFTPAVAAYVATLDSDVGVHREIRGFAEVARAKGVLETELTDIASGEASSVGLGRRASSLGLAALPLYAADAGTVGLVAAPLALALIFANEFAAPRWRAFRDQVRGVRRQLDIIERVLTERERLAGGGRALSIVRGRVKLPVRVHRALMRRRSVSAGEVRAMLHDDPGDALQEVWFDSVFYTDLRTAEPRWLFYYRVPRASAPDPRAPPRPAGRGLLTEF